MGGGGVCEGKLSTDEAFDCAIGNQLQQGGGGVTEGVGAVAAVVP